MRSGQTKSELQKSQFGLLDARECYDNGKCADMKKARRRTVLVMANQGKPRVCNLINFGKKVETKSRHRGRKTKQMWTITHLSKMPKKAKDQEKIRKLLTLDDCCNAGANSCQNWKIHVFTWVFAPHREQNSVEQKPHLCPQPRASCVFLQRGHNAASGICVGAFGSVLGGVGALWLDPPGLGFVADDASTEKCQCLLTWLLLTLFYVQSKLFLDTFIHLNFGLFLLFMAIHNFHYFGAFIFSQVAQIRHRHAVCTHDVTGVAPTQPLKRRRENVVNSVKFWTKYSDLGKLVGELFFLLFFFVELTETNEKNVHWNANNTVEVNLT